MHHAPYALSSLSASLSTIEISSICDILVSMKIRVYLDTSVFSAYKERKTWSTLIMKVWPGKRGFQQII